MQGGETHLTALNCLNIAITNAHLEMQQRALHQATLENLDVMRPMPLLRLPLPMPQLPLPQMLDTTKPKELAVLRARPLVTQNAIIEPPKPMAKPDRLPHLPMEPQQNENDSLAAQLEQLERVARASKHKHRKGLTCPRCKADQAVKRLRKRIAKGKTQVANHAVKATAVMPVAKNDFENRPQAKNVKAGGFLPHASFVEMNKELARVESMVAHLDFHAMDSDNLARTVFDLEREMFMLKHRHFKGVTCPKCKIEQKAKTARKVLMSRKSLQRKRKRTEGTLFFDMVHNGAISGLAALADIAELAS